VFYVCLRKNVSRKTKTKIFMNTNTCKTKFREILRKANIFSLLILLTKNKTQFLSQPLMFYNLIIVICDGVARSCIILIEPEPYQDAAPIMKFDIY
jgi:hypothetical protein